MSWSLSMCRNVRVAALYVGDQPAPERKRLRVRIVDTKHSNTGCDPEQDDVAQLLPKRAPFRAAEIEWIDILVFLWRIFGVLHAAVGAVCEPQRMLRDVGMIRRALKRDVQCDF
jgi:hypothetical protein